MADFIKGEKPRDLDAAKGGLVLDRIRSFVKDPDDFHPMGTGMNGPENCQSYAKTGTDPVAIRKGDTKARSMGTLKKSKATAL